MMMSVFKSSEMNDEGNFPAVFFNIETSKKNISEIHRSIHLVTNFYWNVRI